jgi:DNA-binding beta-propeller fold protein YncE
LLAKVPTAARPYAIEVDEVRDRVYVSNTFSNQLTVIEGKTNIATNLKTGPTDAIVVDAQRGKVYLLGYESDSLTVLDEETDAISKISAGSLHL